MSRKQKTMRKATYGRKTSNLKLKYSHKTFLHNFRLLSSSMQLPTSTEASGMQKDSEWVPDPQFLKDCAGKDEDELNAYGNFLRQKGEQEYVLPGQIRNAMRLAALTKGKDRAFHLKAANYFRQKLSLERKRAAKAQAGNGVRGIERSNSVEGVQDKAVPAPSQTAQIPKSIKSKRSRRASRNESEEIPHCPADRRMCHRHDFHLSAAEAEATRKYAQRLKSRLLDDDAVL